MDAVGLSAQLADAVARVESSVVRVTGRPGPPASGIAWSEDTVVTADHVVEVEHEEGLRIGLPDGREQPATLLGRDPSVDLAVLRVHGAGLVPPSGATASPRAGSLALAVGRPGAGPSASLALISSVEAPTRTHRGGVLQRGIRVDAVLYPGFSGSALVDVTGAVLGMNVSPFPTPGPGLAIPWAELGPLVEAIVRQGRVVRGYLGIGVQAVDLDAPAQALAGGQTRGLLVTQVAVDGPAAAAGFFQGDLLLSLDGAPVPPAGGVEGDVFFHHAVPFQMPLPPPGPGPRGVMLQLHRTMGPGMPPPGPFPPGAMPMMAGFPPPMPPFGPGGLVPPPEMHQVFRWFNRAIGESDDLQAFLGPDRVGTVLAARLLRGGEIKELSVTVGPRP
jgi:S1-C subfamily serine protease